MSAWNLCIIALMMMLDLYDMYVNALTLRMTTAALLSCVEGILSSPTLCRDQHQSCLLARSLDRQASWARQDLFSPVRSLSRSSHFLSPPFLPSLISSLPPP